MKILNKGCDKMELINGGHSSNYNDSYFFLLSENLMEQALFDLN